MKERCKSMTHLQRAGASTKHSGVKVNVDFRSLVPFEECARQSFEAFKSEKPDMHNTRRDNTFIEQGHKCEEKTPFFSIFTPQTVPIRLNYCAVVVQLLQILVAIYNKMDDISLDKGVLNALKSIDSHIKNDYCIFFLFFSRLTEQIFRCM